MKKIGIITFHCSYNYGSMLQAYALQTYVKSLGYDVKIIDFVMEQDFEQYKLFRTNLYKKQLKSLLADIVFFFPHFKRKRNFESFAKERFILTEKRYFSWKDLKELNSTLDIFICGSDQIWNIDCTHGIEPAYFLKFAADNKTKIAYAPSLAHTSFECGNKQELKELLNRFNAISVREESTIPYLQGVLDERIQAVLDPTLLLSRQAYTSLINKKKKFFEKYIFVYFLETNEELVKYCEKLKDSTGLKLYYVSYKVNCGMNVGKNLFGMSPENFLLYIDSAEYVLTNSFHATVFSIIFKKKFCTFPTKRSSSRMVDLLKKLGLEQRIYSKNFDFNAEIDYDNVLNKLNDLKKQSISFLNEALSEENIL